MTMSVSEVTYRLNGFCEALLLLRTSRVRCTDSERRRSGLRQQNCLRNPRVSSDAPTARLRSENKWIVWSFHAATARLTARPTPRFVALDCPALLQPDCASAENNSARDTSAPFSTRATHLLGFANASNNSTGTLSVQDDSLQFQQNGKPAAQVKIALVRDVFLGAESKQVGGLPMTLGKTAAPFGGGRVVSLFAHEKYDTLTLEYVDADGGIHGAIFQLKKGQAELVKNELMAQGLTINSAQDQSTKESATEAKHEDK